MTKPKCIVCGRTKNLEKIEISKGHYLHICFLPRTSCKNILTLKLNYAVPVVWVARDDLYDPDSSNEILTEKEADNLTDKDLMEIAGSMADFLWGGDFSNEFAEIKEAAVESWRCEKEKALIKDSSIDALLLLVGKIKYPENVVLLEQRLKGKWNGH